MLSRSRNFSPCRFVLLLVSASCGLIWTPAFSAAQDPSVVHAQALSRAFRTAAGRASPSVVTIIAKVKASEEDFPAGLRELLRDPRFRDLFPPDQRPDRESPPERGRPPRDLPLPELESHVGSGVIIDASGLVLTNNHVVEGADNILVRLPDGQEFEAAEAPQTDPLSDLAVLRIKDAGKLQAAQLGDSDKLEIGDWVIAIGSPFELEATVSAGIISGKGRGIDQIRRGRLLQTDAAINPGNSGGPLVNLEGEVIGINTAIATNSGGYQGIGFAIPINRAKWVVQQLTRYGHVQRAYLGIRIADVTPEVARTLKVPVRSGVVVMDALPDSPAAEAGLKPDDVIVEVDGMRVIDSRSLQDAVEQQALGSKLAVKILRGGQSMTVSVGVKTLPDDPRTLPLPNRPERP